MNEEHPPRDEPTREWSEPPPADEPAEAEPEASSIPPPEDEAQAEAPSEDAAVSAPETSAEPPRRIWDPGARAWVTEEELASGAAPAAAAPPAPYVPEAVSAAPAARAPRPAPAGLPHSLTAVIAGVTGAVLAVVAVLFVPGFIDRRPQLDRPRIVEGAGSVPASEFADLARQARPWVVTVVAAGSTQSILGAKEFRRAGSGVVITDDGAIATPARLVDGADKVAVTTSSGRAAEAKVVGSDKLTDIAILRVDVPDLSPAALGTTESLELGDPVVAVSAQNGLQTMVATGAISAMGRTVDPGEGELMLDMLLVDSPLGSTGSGGALVAGGSLVGMTASFGEGSFGYATPIDIVRAVGEQILAGKDVAHPWIGLTVDKADGETADGLVVATVFKDGPAERAAMKAGDLIVSIDGAEVRGTLSLLRRLLEAEVGADITLQLQRGMSTEDVTLKVGERPSLKK